MIDQEGVLVHLDPEGDRIGDEALLFTGWVAARQPIRAVWLPACGKAHLTTCERPDVQRVFPDRITLGFRGKCASRALAFNRLRLAVELADRVLEVEHPVPPALPAPPLGRRLAGALQLGWLRLRERLATRPGVRFGLTLRRHLVARHLRGGLFQRRHSDALLADFATSMPEAVFLQIGANDGFTGDPINHLIRRIDTRWQGVLVEPVAHLFAQLSERYGTDPALRLEHAAIGETDGTTVIHRLQTSLNDSLWLEQIPSLDSGLLRKNAAQFGEGEAPAIQESVTCLSVATLLSRHSLSRLDLLVIDTEGWDWKILRQFDLARLRPRLILYEHQHLSPEEQSEAQQFLSQHGYDWVATEEGDTLAWVTP